MAVLAGLLPAQEPSPVATATPAAAATLIRPGDSLWVDIYPEQTLSSGYTVDASGAVDFRKLGRVSAASMTADSLRRLLVARYSVTLRDPSVSVRVFPRVTVDGAVQRSGARALDATFTIAQAVAEAGVLPTGDADRVRLEREGAATEVNLRAGSPMRNEPIRSGDRLVVPERSWLSRNSGVVMGMVGAVSSIVAALLLR
ncbi:MAG TPA: polysaccharide biosynthesis/export family protein [Gemmatimonadaceae bacterium]|nr:polysaccharide biosynthesis/export family protein [Gemmatimonadaceae bacterium]